MIGELREILSVVAAIAAAAGLVVLAIAFWLWLQTRKRLHAGRALRVVASDTGLLPPIVLEDTVLGLRGRPDYVVAEMVDGQSRLIPLEVKPTRRGARLYESDAAQVGAYLIASRATLGERASDFGYVHYANRSFRVPLTATLERRVLSIIAGIRKGRRTASVRRSHSISTRCLHCAMRAHCDEALK